MGQILRLKRGAKDNGNICDAALRGIAISKTEAAWLSKFVREQGLREDCRTHERIDSAFVEHFRHYRIVCPTFPLSVAAEQSCRWSRQITEKVSRYLKEHSSQNAGEGEVRCVVDFCINRRIVTPEKRIATQFIDLSVFLMEYVAVRKTRKGPWDACVSAAVRYHGERALRLKK